MKTLIQILILLGLIAALLGSAFYGVRGEKGWALPLVAGLLCCTLIYFIYRDRFRRGKAESASFVVAMLSAFVGAGLVVGAFKVSILNWVVDAPGWLVGRFLPIDFHEGEGALGFVLALLLSWVCASTAAWLVMSAIWKHYRAGIPRFGRSL